MNTDEELRVAFEEVENDTFIKHRIGAPGQKTRRARSRRRA